MASFTLVLFNVLGIPANWLWGAVFGLIHGIVLGAMLPIMPSTHPRMGDGNVLSPLGAYASKLWLYDPHRLDCAAHYLWCCDWLAIQRIHMRRVIYEL